MTLFEQNAEILRSMEADGGDLGHARSVDFSHVFPDQVSAHIFAHDAQREGFSTTVEKIKRQDYLWDVTASKVMTPTCGNITDAEVRLDAQARLHGGSADGWGFFRV